MCHLLQTVSLLYGPRNIIVLKEDGLCEKWFPRKKLRIIVYELHQLFPEYRKLKKNIFILK